MSATQVETAAVLRDRRPWLTALVLGALVLGVFYPALDNGFVYDDHENFVSNPHYRGLGWQQLAWMFTTFHKGHYRPLSWMSLGLDYVLWGDNPRGYHVTNVLLHSANTVLVYLLGLQILAAGHPLTGFVHVSAVLAALLVAVHPLRVESVAWVTERSDVLSMFFLLLAVLAYLRAHAASTRRPLPWLVGAVVVYACSLLSRAMGMTFPVVLLVLDWYPLRRWPDGPGRWFGPAARRVWLEKIPFLVLGLAAAATAPLAQSAAGATITLADHGVLARVAQACYGLTFYVWKMLVPVGLIPLYELRLPLNIWSPKYLIPAAVVVLVIVVLARYGRRMPAVTAVVLLHAILLSPVLGLVACGQTEVAARYTYGASVGWSLLVGGGLVALWRRRHWLRAPGVVLVAVAVAALAGQTRQYVKVWRDDLTLWSYTLKHDPKCSVAYANLGVALAERGDRLGALANLKKAAALTPNLAENQSNLAAALLELGRPGEALAHAQRALALKPNDATAHVVLAGALAGVGQPSDALRALRAALQLDPRQVRAHVLCGDLLVGQGDLPQAAEHYRAALGVAPDDPVACANLGLVLVQLGRLAEALPHLRRAVSVTPDNANAHFMLATALNRLGQPLEALTYARRAVELQPTDAEAHELVGRIIETSGDPAGATAHYRRALELARAAGNAGLAGRIEQRLLTCQQGQAPLAPPATELPKP